MLDEVTADLGAQSERGRGGSACESIPRCAVLKHLYGETWRGLAFALEDSRSACRFARVEPLVPPKKLALRAAVGAVSAETWERADRCLLEAARATAYGHKINLATGRSGLVLDVVVESGNPADSARCPQMLQWHRAHYGKPLTHAAFDGGYASKENLKRAQTLGVAHTVFSNRRGLKEVDMTPSPWIFERLRRFRAGVEAGISWLKRCFGLGRCRWRGLPHFRTWVHSTVFAHNLVRIAWLRSG